MKKKLVMLCMAMIMLSGCGTAVEKGSVSGPDATPEPVQEILDALHQAVIPSAEEAVGSAVEESPGEPVSGLPEESSAESSEAMAEGFSGVLDIVYGDPYDGPVWLGLGEGMYDLMDKDLTYHDMAGILGDGAVVDEFARWETDLYYLSGGDTLKAVFDGDGRIVHATVTYGDEPGALSFCDITGTCSPSDVGAIFGEPDDTAWTVDGDMSRMHYRHLVGKWWVYFEFEGDDLLKVEVSRN